MGNKYERIIVKGRVGEFTSLGEGPSHDWGRVRVWWDSPLGVAEWYVYPLSVVIGVTEC